jgi:hypothetical protein
VSGLNDLTPMKYCWGNQLREGDTIGVFYVYERKVEERFSSNVPLTSALVGGG